MKKTEFDLHGDNLMKLSWLLSTGQVVLVSCCNAQKSEQLIAMRLISMPNRVNTNEIRKNHCPGDRRVLHEHRM